MEIKQPFLIVFENDGKVQTHLYPGTWNHKHYGVLVVDIVRHVANAFKVREDEVWEWVDKERSHHTSAVTELKPN